MISDYNSFPPTPNDIDHWLLGHEDERIEFKEAKQKYSFDRLAKYCCAVANEGGGRIILGVTDQRPRSVTGTAAFPQIESTRRSLMEQIPLLISVWEVKHPDGRVVVIDVPSRPIGMPVKFQRVYWSRSADSLVPMAEDRLRTVFEESGIDFSARICPDGKLDHLDPQAIETFRRRWREKSGNTKLDSMSHDQILRDAELIVDGGITYAALILFGTRLSIGRLLPNAEAIFEYRANEASGPAQQREEYREGFFLFSEKLWKTIALRNDVQHYEDGMFVFDIPTFAERSVREALLNAICHRNYQLGGSVFVRQYPRRLLVESPGGLPVGITPENIIDRQSPRNRRLAEAFARCGLVERSGQGMNLMFEEAIRHGKSQPDLYGTDAFHVFLTLHGEIQDPRFVQFLEKVGNETLTSFDTHDFRLIDAIHREADIPNGEQQRLRRLTELGILERISRGRGTRYLLSARFYSAIGQRGTYTRKRGLNWMENKALLLQHLKDCKGDGCRMSELQMVLPSQSRNRIKRLLNELREEGKIRLTGTKRGARWIFTIG